MLFSWRGWKTPRVQGIYVVTYLLVTALLFLLLQTAWALVGGSLAALGVVSVVEIAYRRQESSEPPAARPRQQ
jgi:hypothetical protein